MATSNFLVVVMRGNKLKLVSSDMVTQDDAILDATTRAIKDGKKDSVFMVCEVVSRVESKLIITPMRQALTGTVG